MPDRQTASDTNDTFQGSAREHTTPRTYVTVELTALIARLVELEHQVREMSKRDAEDMFRDAEPHQK